MEAEDSLPIFQLPITNPRPEPEDSNHIQMSYFLQITLIYCSYEYEKCNAAEFKWTKYLWW